jgi:hypothetical protein
MPSLLKQGNWDNVLVVHRSYSSVGILPSFVASAEYVHESM